MPSLLRFVAAGLLDLFWPERCALCGAEPEAVAWSAGGPRVAGLRRWDRPHLCARCGDRLGPRPHLRQLESAGTERLVLAAGRSTDGELVSLLGACKYHGVRGVAWHLGRLVAAAGPLLAREGGAFDALVPIPLHRARKRERGFNQAEVLARLAAEALDLRVLEHALRRRRRTRQQARLSTAGDSRSRNVAGAFAALDAPAAATRVVLVDDLATSGQTLGAAATSLRGAGWDVVGALVAGAAEEAGPRLGLDIPGDDS